MKINLGCQIHAFEGWINQDIVSDDDNIKADWKCDANDLPTENETADFIYAGHLIEHFYPDTAYQYIAEWFRVLKKGGKIVIVTPDSGSAFKRYSAGIGTIDDLLQPVYGRIYSYDRESERHHIVFDYQKLVDTVTLKNVQLSDKYVPVVWSNIQPLDFSNPPEELKPFFASGDISNSTTQLGICLTK